MDRHSHRRGSADGPEYTLSHDSAREVVHRSAPARSGANFLSTDHLSSEAAAAYVDHRLPQAGQVRADAHLVRCAQCRREVDVQREARGVLRGSGPIRMPSDLLDRLRSLEDTPHTEPHRVDDPPRVPHPRDAWERLLRRVRRRGH